MYRESRNPSKRYKMSHDEAFELYQVVVRSQYIKITNGFLRLNIEPSPHNRIIHFFEGNKPNFKRETAIDENLLIKISIFS
jgi:hypothetical protein